VRYTEDDLLKVKNVGEKALTEIADLLRREHVDVVGGSAAFESPQRLIVTREGRSQPLDAERIVLATGARPLSGPWTVDEDRCLSYRGLLALSRLPASLLVIGGGVIGCEFASLLSVCGTKVTLVEQEPQLLPN